MWYWCNFFRFMFRDLDLYKKISISTKLGVVNFLTLLLWTRFGYLGAIFSYLKLETIQNHPQDPYTIFQRAIHSLTWYYELLSKGPSLVYTVGHKKLYTKGSYFIFKGGMIGLALILNLAAAACFLLGARPHNALAKSAIRQNKRTLVRTVYYRAASPLGNIDVCTHVTHWKLQARQFNCLNEWKECVSSSCILFSWNRPWEKWSYSREKNPQKIQCSLNPIPTCCQNASWAGIDHTFK